MKLSELSGAHEFALTFAVKGFNYAVKKVTKCGSLEPRDNVEKSIEAWEEFRDRCLNSANEIIGILKEALEQEGGGK